MGVAEFLLAGDLNSDAFYRAVDAVEATDVMAVLPLAGHHDSRVRAGVALTLPLLSRGGLPAAEVIKAALILSTDLDQRVRDYACLALGEQWREVDTPAVREALAARLDDADREVRCEALVGLAYRLDPRALPRVQAALSRPGGEVWRLEMVAAGALSDPQLHDLVLRHQTGWDEADTTADAARRLTDPAGPGDDLLDGVAELFRRRAHGQPDGEVLAAWRHLDELLDIAPYRAAGFLDEIATRLAGDDVAVRELRTRSALAQLAEERSR